MEKALVQALSTPVHRLVETEVRISVDNDEITTKSSWLVRGRPAYIVIKEDKDGKKEGRKEHHCIICDCGATVEHLATGKHEGRVDQAEWRVASKGYECILEWLKMENDNEVIHLGAPSARDDMPDPPGGVIHPVIAFEDWPFSMLQVDKSTNKKPDSWSPCDDHLVQETTKEAQCGEKVFMVKYKEGWTYVLDFELMTQTNIETDKVRRLKVAVP